MLADIWSFLKAGGIMMFPLLLSSVIALAVIIERAISLRRNKVIPTELVNIINSLKSENDLPLALEICKKNEGVFSNVMRAGLENQHLTKDEIKEIITDTGRQETRKLERPLVILETIAAIAPLLGLLGTILGMFHIFGVLYVKHAGQAQDFSRGISEAMITTIVGLAIAIPTLIAYNYFTSKVDDEILEIEKYSLQLMYKLHAFKEDEKK